MLNVDKCKNMLGQTEFYPNEISNSQVKIDIRQKNKKELNVIVPRILNDIYTVYYKDEIIYCCIWPKQLNPICDTVY